MKRLSEEEIENFPLKNVIVRALGMKATVKVDTVLDRPEIGDIYVLCSDGLCGPVTPGNAIQNPEARTVKGRVTDATTGSPLPGAEITVDDQQFTSDNNGTYLIVLENITETTTLRCTKNDYTTYREKINFSKTQNTWVLWQF